MNEDKPLRIGAVIFEEFELLDLFGPLEMFGLLEKRVEISLVAQKTGPVRSHAGPEAVARTAFGDCDGFDILLVPGGMGTRTLVSDAGFLAELRRLSLGSGTVATVCTGSMLLASTGLLDGLRATTNKRAFDMIRTRFPKVRWQARARWVVEGRYRTASGISAGIDLSLAMIADRFGPDTARGIARRAEYVWREAADDDPFAAA